LCPIIKINIREPKAKTEQDLVGEIGLAGHWLKLALHYAFIYKAKMKPFWLANS